MAESKNNILTKNKKFVLSKYYEKVTGDKKEIHPRIIVSGEKFQQFYDLCDAVLQHFKKKNDTDNKNNADNEQTLERQRNAILGYENEVRYYKNEIEDYLKTYGIHNLKYPEWYSSLIDAIFHENWGLAGIAEWVENKKYQESSSAKIIGNRIYFLINGKATLMPQRISDKRREQLRRALRLNDPEARKKPYEEFHTKNGVRVTIYADDFTMENQDVIVFRKYIIPHLTFEEQAERGTIPFYAIDFFKSMVDVGFNIIIAGPPRTGKSTILETLLMREKPELEGVLIQTDTEIRIHELLPNAPIMNLIARDEKRLNDISKTVMRSDADYFVFAEARDGLSSYVALDVCSRGQNRMKMTYHINSSKVKNICEDIARRIVDVKGGSMYSYVLDIAQSFNYVFEMRSLGDKSKKRLDGIYEIRFNRKTGNVEIHTICKYIQKTDSWTWNYTIGEDKEIIGSEDEISLRKFKLNLKMLAEKYPMNDEDKLTVFDYSYLKEGK